MPDTTTTPETDPLAPELARLIDALGPVPDAYLPSIYAALGELCRALGTHIAARLTLERALTRIADNATGVDLDRAGESLVAIARAALGED